MNCWRSNPVVVSELLGELLCVPSFGFEIEFGTRYSLELARQSVEIDPGTDGFRQLQPTDGL